MTRPEGMDLFGIMTVLWKRRLVILLAAMLGVGAAVIYLHYATFYYTSELRVTPVQEDAGNLGGGLGGLASMAGFSLGKGMQATSFDLYLEELGSREVAQELSLDHALMQTVFVDRWDARTGQWRQPQGNLESVKRAVKRLLGVPIYSWRPPGAPDLQQYIVTNLEVEDSDEKSATVLRFEHRDPRFAHTLLWRLHRTADDAVSRRALARTTAYIAYLEAKLAQVTLTEHRQALGQSLIEQERQRMIASSGLPYAADPLGDVAVSPRPTWPRPLSVLLLGLIGGGVIGMIAAFFAHMLRQMRSTAAHPLGTLDNSNAP
nr:Wzz/FepE/Etk N-terminal domain-containing protein [Sphingosinicella soli]